MQNFRDDALIVQEICSFIHFILISYFSQYPSQTISPCPYPTYIVAFHLVSSDLHGGNEKKKTHVKRNVAYTLFFTLFKKHFSGYGLARKGKKKNVFLCDV